MWKRIPAKIKLVVQYTTRQKTIITAHQTARHDVTCQHLHMQWWHQHQGFYLGGGGGAREHFTGKKWKFMWSSPNLVFSPFLCWNRQIWSNFNTFVIFGEVTGKENIGGTPMALPLSVCTVCVCFQFIKIDIICILYLNFARASSCMLTKFSFCLYSERQNFSPCLMQYCNCILFGIVMLIMVIVVSFLGYESSIVIVSYLGL